VSEGRGQAGKVRLAASACMDSGCRRIEQGGVESEGTMVMIMMEETEA
jgi:hypothetical protein